MNKDAKYDLAGRVIGCAMAVHRELGAGFCEAVYQNALIYELKLIEISAETEKKIDDFYKEVIVGNFSADLIIANKLILELKAVRTLVTAHEVQLVNYLTATGIQTGLLLNFGATSLEYKKKHRNYQAPKTFPHPPRLQG